MNFKCAFRQYGKLLKISYLNTKGDKIKRQQESVSARKGLGKAGYWILLGFGVLAILVFEFSLAAQLAVAAVAANAVESTLYVLIGITQLIVMFFGILTTMGYLYFSKDQKLLSTLPFEKGVVFAVKTTEAYLGELLINCVVFIPVTVSYGIIAEVSGYSLPWTYYPVAVLASLMTPAVPMLVITLISLPVMRLAALLRKRRVGNGVALALLYLIFMAAYFALIGVNGSGDGIQLGANALETFDGINGLCELFHIPCRNHSASCDKRRHFYALLQQNTPSGGRVGRRGQKEGECEYRSAFRSRQFLFEGVQIAYSHADPFDERHFKRLNAGFDDVFRQVCLLRYFHGRRTRSLAYRKSGYVFDRHGDFYG